MKTELDWIGRDLHRLATEAKLARMPTPSEWERIWCAATEWAATSGIVPADAPIDAFVRQHAPGVLREVPAAFATPGFAPTLSAEEGAPRVPGPSACQH